MAQQVKFFQVDALPASPAAGNLYFVNDGENHCQLYKGSKLVGAARVTALETAPATALRGDINIYGGVAKVYDGAAWQTLGGAGALNVALVGNNGEGATVTDIIVGVSESNGLVSAFTQAFPKIATGDELGQVKLNGVSAKVNGWDDLYSKVNTDLESRVSSIETVVDGAAKTVTASTVTADTGNFKNLNVSNTATFNATTVSATTLSVDTEDGATFGGSTISAIADRQIAAIAEASASAADDGVEVKVVTQSGSIKSVEVAVAATSQAADINKDNEALARAKDVAAYIADVAKAMHFRGLATVDEDGKVTPTDGNATNVAGDVVITTTGKEYVWTGEAWQELGDETAFGQLVDYTGYSTALTTTSKTLAGGINELDAAIKAMDSSFTTEADNGVSAAITQEDGVITAFGLTVDAIESAAGIVSGEAKVVTAGAVADKIAGIVADLDASVSASDKGVVVEVVEEDGKLISASVSVTTVASMAFNATGDEEEIASTKAVRDYFENNLVWLGSDSQPIEGVVLPKKPEEGGVWHVQHDGRTFDLMPFGQAPDYEWRSQEVPGMNITSGWLSMGEYMTQADTKFVNFLKYNETQTFDITTGWDDQGGAITTQVKLTWTPA